MTKSKIILMKKYLKENFHYINIFSLLCIFFIFHFTWSKYIPIADIEAYYWDWSRDLSLGYYDHPGAVAWFCKLGTYITNNSSNLRFFVPIFNFLTCIFLILSYTQICKILEKEVSIKKIYFLILIFNTIPVFSFQSFILMPDFCLLLFLSAYLYLLLKIIYYMNIKNKFSYYICFLLGISAGMGANSKYHMLPIIFANLITIYYFKFLKNKFYIFIFFFLLSFIITFLPTLIWNFNHGMVSFIFQLNHGFGSKEYSFWNPFLFIIESSLYITPIIFYYFIRKTMIIRRPLETITLEFKIKCLLTMPICFLLIVFLFAAFFDKIPPYWLSPVFIIIIPLYIFDLEKINIFEKNVLILSIIVSIIIPTLLSSREIRNYFIAITNGKIGYKLFFWDILANEKIERIANLKIPSSVNFEKIKESGCKKDETIIATLNWTWAAQLAFHLSNKPYVYNLDYKIKSFYNFRDDIENLNNCKILLISSNTKTEDFLYQIRNIDFLKVIEIKEFSTKEEFHNLNIVRGIYSLPKEKMEVIDNF